MDSYIVGIYHGRTANTHELVGVVENVELEETLAFKTVDGLWILFALDRSEKRKCGWQIWLLSLLLWRLMTPPGFMKEPVPP